MPQYSDTNLISVITPVNLPENDTSIFSHTRLINEGLAIFNPSPPTCCRGLAGNANGDSEDKANVADVSYLVSWLFGIPSGPAPLCIAEANANGDIEDKVNVSDVSYLVEYLFGIPSGPAPPLCQ